jgi:hypothetical protein
MSKTTEKVISIRVADDSTSTLRNMVKVMRSVATAMRQIANISKVIEALQKAEFLNTMALGSAYRYLALMKGAASMIGIGAAVLAVAASVGMLAAGTVAQPVSFQTAPGSSRQVSRTGMAVVHAGETVSRGIGGTGRGSGITINIDNMNVRSPQEAEEAVTLLNTTVFQAMRRYRH